MFTSILVLLLLLIPAFAMLTFDQLEQATGFSRGRYQVPIWYRPFILIGWFPSVWALWAFLLFAEAFDNRKKTTLDDLFYGYKLIISIVLTGYADWKADAEDDNSSDFFA